MTYTQFRQLVYASAKSDWLYDDDKGIFTFKNDLNITIRIARDDEEDRSFVEPWHQSLPDKRATRSIYELYYGSSYVVYEFIVNVDGGRAAMPLPEDGHGKPWITGNQKSFGDIIDRMGSFDEYLRRCNIEVR